MFSRFQLALKYLHYYFTASSNKGHGIHSPFVFHFITKVLNDRTHYPSYDIVEKLRHDLLRNKTLLTIEDFGAGSAIDKSNQRTIASIAKHATKSKKHGQLLFRMVKEYKPQNILELGTSLGITTAYLASANPDAKVITMEGAQEISNIAQQNFNTSGLQNAKLVEGNFDNTLQSTIAQLPSVDFAFIDGNHRREPTERYFQQLLPKTHRDSVLIFDDIHWSAGMEAAWQTIREHPSVRCSVDLFFIGIVFFRQEFKEKQHFRIRF